MLLALGVALAAPPQQSKQPAKKAEEPKKKRLVANLSGFELQDASKMRAENTKLGATRGGLQPEALAPKLAKFYGPSAVFVWSYPGKAKTFAIIFCDEDVVEIFRAKVTGTHYVLRVGAVRFEPGKTYSWMVEVSPPLLGTSPSGPAQFVVVSGTERAEIEKALAQIAPSSTSSASSASLLARARVFTDHRLWFDAIGAYTELIAKFPDRAELYEARGAIYHQLKATQPLADSDFARADQLQTTKPTN